MRAAALVLAGAGSPLSIAQDEPASLFGEVIDVRVVNVEETGGSDR